ncbi:MAG: COP9 signalosome (CSN) subunit [Geoglossum umbratile]|nr:MAG: COP9 signalosome (CSN) subunit [Geoglossum umbratile]
MDNVFADFREAHQIWSGPLLSTTLLPINPASDPNRLINFYRDSEESKIQADIRYHVNAVRLSSSESKAWVDVFIAFWKAIGELLPVDKLAREGRGTDADWTSVYEAWKELSNALIRGYTNGGFQAWTVPCLYVAGKHLRIFAIKADDQSASKKGVNTFTSGFQEDVVGDQGKNEKLEDAARVINRIFTLCISDRAPLEESRKWGLYYTTNLLFKTYFKLNSIGLSKNILRALEASSSDMPPLEAFPKSHIVTFKYYVGVIWFLEEDYVKAEENLTEAWNMCHKDAQKNRELILTYLIPTRLLTTHTLPTTSLLSPYPRLRTLFTPLCQSLKRGDLARFDAALIAGEDQFVKRRIYLTLERGRDIALRNLLRKVFLAGGLVVDKEGQKVRRTRIDVEEFGAGISMAAGVKGGAMERDEVECLLANMIYKGLMKGYISREHGKVVLSTKGNAFPGTGV